MRLGAVICAILAVSLAGPAGAQSYPYLATLPVADLIAPTAENAPQDLAFDATGNRLLIAEGPNQVVQIVDGTSFAPLATLGVAGVSGGDASHFSNPSGVTIDPVGNRILVADTGNDRVQLFDATSFALVGTLGQTGAPGADNAHLSSPTGVAIDAVNSRIVIADTGNDRVQLFDAKSLSFIGTIGVAGVPGTDNGHLSTPRAAVLDPTSGNLLVADTGNGRIQVFAAQSAGYLGTIGAIGNITNLGIDVVGRRLYAANPTDYDVVVIDADALAPVSTLGLVGSFGIDNARFLLPSGMGFDPGTGRIFAGDAALNRIQIFGQPSLLFAATAPGGRAFEVNQTASVYATILNTGANALDNCQIALPNDAPQGLVLTYQTTNPANNFSTGQPNQPVTIGANSGQSFILTLSANTPVSAPGQTLLFTCDGTTPAPIFSGVNTSDLTVTPGPTADIIADAAVPGGTGTITLPGSSTQYSAFAVSAFNFGASALLQVTADDGSYSPTGVNGSGPGFYQTLPLTVLICQTNPFNGDCLATAAPQLVVDLPSGASASFSVFVASTGGAIPASLSEPRLFIRFSESTGSALPESVGSASVGVVTGNQQ